MANRGDFLGHLPRGYKKLIRLGLAHGHIQDVHQAADVRKLFVKAHKDYKKFKLNRKSAIPADLTSKAEPAEVAA